LETRLIRQYEDGKGRRYLTNKAGNTFRLYVGASVDAASHQFDIRRPKQQELILFSGELYFLVNPFNHHFQGGLDAVQRRG